MNRRNPFENDHYYHVYNRGVDKRLIFKSKGDYKRFVFMLEKFNMCEPVNNFSRDIQRRREGKTKSQKIKCIPMVKIHSYCLMPNHYHLILEQLIDGGISKFLQKTMTGYTLFFNTRYERNGVLFQGRTKSKLIDNDDYLRWLKCYIAMNPLDLCESEWKEKGIRDKSKSLQFLKNYEWRSQYDYSDFKSYLKDLKESEYEVFN